MAVSLSTLVSRLQSAVPARDGVPSTEQYEQCVKDAVADYSRRNPNQKVTTLNIISGTASYDLPSDFLFVIRLEALASVDDVIISHEGLIPISALYEERWTIAGRQITFSPTPTYNKSRTLWYAAGHVLNANSEYPDMTDEDASLLMLKAQALALQLQANAAAGNAWKYAIGDEQVDKTNQEKAIREQAAFLEREYLEAVRAAVGGVGMRADYNRLGH